MTNLDEIYQVLKPAMAGDDAAIMRDVAKGIAWAYQVNLDNDKKNYWIVRSEGTELIVMCVAGVDLEAACAHWYQAAKMAGFKTARFHTQRPGLARLLKAWGPTLTEYVHRVALDGRIQ